MCGPSVVPPPPDIRYTCSVVLVYFCHSFARGSIYSYTGREHHNVISADCGLSKESHLPQPFCLSGAVLCLNNKPNTDTVSVCFAKLNVNSLPPRPPPIGMCTLTHSLRSLSIQFRYRLCLCLHGRMAGDRP